MLLELALRLCWLYQPWFPVARFLKQPETFYFVSIVVEFFKSSSVSMLRKSSAQFSAGAIYLEKGSFTQLGGTLTITDASAGSDGGVVRIHRNPFLLGVL